MIVGCYTLHLYCDRGECADGGAYTPEEFTRMERVPALSVTRD
jgi:hypothetical protein